MTNNESVFQKTECNNKSNLYKNMNELFTK